MEFERSAGRYWAAVTLALGWLGAYACGGDDGGSSTTSSHGATGGSGGSSDASGGSAGERSTEAGGSAGEVGTGGTNSGGTNSGATSSGGTSSGGTGGHESFLPLYENGSRLRAVSLGEIGSTARQLQVWYDTELETECSFARAEDGEFRCLPLRQSLSPGFSDPECEQAVYYDGKVVPCTEVPPYRGEEIEVEGCAGTRIVRMQPISTTEVYHESCSAQPTELPSGSTVWQDDEVLPPETFVAATERERMSALGFGIREWIGEDGSRQVVGLVDEARGACSPRELAGAGWRCLPTPAYLDSPWWFADEACSSDPLAYGVKVSACSEPVSLALSIDVEGSGLPSLLSLGEPVSGTVYEKSFSTTECTAHPAEEVLWTLYPIEGQFDATQLFELTDTALGSERIRTLHNTIEETLLTLVLGDGRGPVFFDEELGTRCVAFRYEGSWICVPDNYTYAYELHYADADCSEPLVGLASESELLLFVERNHCVREGFADDVLEIYATEELYSGDVYSDAGGDCHATEANPDLEYYRVAPAADAYAELDEIIE